LDYRGRVAFQRAKFKSVDKDGELAVYHVVFTTPPFLVPVIREDPKALGALRRAAWFSVARSFGYDAARDASREMHALFNLHAWGDEATPYPVFRPHYDVVIGATAHAKGAPPRRLPQHWPALFKHTRAFYADALRAEFRKLKSVEAVSVRRNLDALRNVQVHVAGAGRDADGNSIPGQRRTGGHAAHTLWYSSRPLFHMGHGRLIKKKGVVTWRHEPQGAEIVHDREPAEFFREVRSLLQFLGGSRARVWLGTFERRTYPALCRRLGVTPVPWRKYTGASLRGVYMQDLTGRFGEAMFRPLRALDTGGLD
jgi:hypothetical protein